MFNNKYIKLTVNDINIDVVATYCCDRLFGENLKIEGPVALAHFEGISGFQSKEIRDEFDATFGGNVAGVFDRTTGEIISMFSRKEHGGAFFDEALRDFDRRTH